MRFFLGICLVCMMHLSVYAKSQTEVMLVMDMSGSMYGKIGGRLKVDHAREAVLNQLEKLDSGVKIGLTVMGGQRGRRGCRNYQTVIPVARETKHKIQYEITHTKPRGKTPLAGALKKAIQHFSNPNDALIVLVSDGKERCGNHAYDVLKMQGEKYPNLRMDVISLATDMRSKDKLMRMSDLMHGSFDEPYTLVTANTEKELLSKKELLSPPTSPMIKIFAALPRDDSDGQVIHTIYTSKDIQVQSCNSTFKKECTVSLSSGTYSVHSRYGRKEHITKLLVLDGMDAFVYTSFQKKNGENQLSDKPVEIASEGIERMEKERAFREEERLQEALARGERRRDESKGLLGLHF